MGVLICIFDVRLAHEICIMVDTQGKRVPTICCRSQILIEAFVTQLGRNEWYEEKCGG